MNTTNYTPKTYKQIIQDNIIRLTTHANVSYRELSAAIDASPSYIQKVVEGRYAPTLSKLALIAAYFDVPTSTLLIDYTAPSSKELVTEITDHLIKLEDKNLEFVLTITKELYNKQN